MTMTSRSESDEHPAFLAAAGDVRWTGSKTEMWRKLSVRALRAEGNRWVWFILPEGVIVECQAPEPGRKMVRFWWEPAEPGPGSRFRAACERILTHFSIVGQWELVDQGAGAAPDGREGCLFAWFQQRFGLHDIEARCEECGSIILKDERAPRQLCVRCAPKAAEKPQEELAL